MSLRDARRRHVTQLRVRGPSPQPHKPLGESVDGAERVEYPSAGLSLAGLFVPPRERQRAPALLYLHGGWALDDEHVHQCRPFLDAGFAVFTPSYRGENGNDGAHEMLWGELDDALSALAYLRSRPEVDAERVFVFGHSAGGMLAALMAFEPELDARLTGSIDGIYGPEIFDYQRPPFIDTPLERELRLALPHIESLEQPHVALVGRDDLALASTLAAAERAEAAGIPLAAVVVPGNHRESIAPGMAAFLACVTRVS
jgi:pimeloyl-ACP methyl ester carboxylesterase